jgi:hypothetical protein
MMYTREFDRFSMKGETGQDDAVILSYLNDEVPLFADNEGRVWTEGDVYIARYVDTEPGDGIGC